MNPPLGKALDAQVESLLGKTLLELGVAGDSRRRLEDSIARAFDEGVPNTLECTWSTAGGERTFEVRNFPERDDAGRTTSVLGVARDITEYRRVEEALRRPLRTNEAMLSQAITCFALLDGDYRFIRVNESFAREYQRDAHEFVGRRLGELLPAYAADDDRRRRLLDDLVLSKRPAQFSSWPYEFVDQPERSTTYWDWILQPILDEHGEVEFVFVSGIDVTERRRAEDAVRARESAFRGLADNIPDLIVRWDRDLRRLYVNPAFARAACRPAEQLIGQRYGTGYAPEVDHPGVASVATLEAKLRQVFDSGQGEEVESTWNVAGGVRFYHTRLVPELDESGAIATVLGIGRDITALKETEAQFLALSEHSPDIIVRYDREGRYLYANSAIERVTGIPARNFIGRAIGDASDGRWERASSSVVTAVGPAYSRGL